MDAGELIGNALSAVRQLSSVVSIASNVTRIGTDIFVRRVQFRSIERQVRANLSRQAGVDDNNRGGTLQDNDQPERDWKDLYKEDLQQIYRQLNGRDATENELGEYLEDKLEEVFDRAGGQMTRNDEILTDAGDRNSKPDFTGPATYTNFYINEKNFPFYLHYGQ